MTHEKMTILDVEQKNNSFTVVFEVPGKHYNQDYPKRLSHSFPKEPGLLEKDDSGRYGFEDILERNYLRTEEDRERERQVDQQLGDVAEDVKGKTKQGGSAS